MNLALKSPEPRSGILDIAAYVPGKETFSKIYGLAGLRIGWMYAPRDVVEALDRVRGPFNLNAPAIAAGAAAIRDQAFVAEAGEHNHKWLARVSQALTKIGLRVTPSVTNFVLIHFPAEAGMSAGDADAYLTSRGFILRSVGAYGFPNALRMMIGSEEANEGVVAALTEFMGRK